MSAASPSTAALARATALLTERFGVRAPASDLASATLSAKLAEGETDLEALLCPLLNHHTWFLRDRAQLEALVAELRVRGPGPHVVWCAGCSTGEEAYSLVLVAACAGLEVRVVGSDIGSAALERAREGRFSELAIRHVEPAQRARWFEPSEGGYRVIGTLRDRVSFVRHNLMDAVLRPEAPLSGWDAIVCRNVLIHWSQPHARSLVERLKSAIHERGSLVLGAADVLMTCSVHASVASAETRSRSPSSMPVTRSDTRVLLRAAREPLEPAPRPLLPGLESLARGNRLLAVRDYEGAISAYAAGADVDDAAIAAEACLLAGVALRRAAELDASVAALRRATFLDPALWQAWWALAASYDALGLAGRARAARRAARALLDEEPTRALWSDVRDVAGLDLSAERARVLLGACEVSVGTVGAREGARWRRERGSESDLGDERPGAALDRVSAAVPDRREHDAGGDRGAGRDGLHGERG